MCVEKLEKQFSLLHRNKKLKQRSRVKTENGPISGESQPGVSMMRSMVETIY